MITAFDLKLVPSAQPVPAQSAPNVNAAISLATVPQPAPVPTPPKLALYANVGLAGVGPSSGSGAVSASGNILAATCQPADAVGAFVYAMAGAGGTLSVTTADSATPNQTAIGLITSMTGSGQCNVTLSGVVTGVFGNLSPGVTYYLGPRGSLVTMPLTGQVVYVQRVGVALSATSLFVNVALHPIKRCFT